MSSHDELANISKLESVEGFAIPCLSKSKTKVDLRPLASPKLVNSDIAVTIYEPLECKDDDQGAFRKLIGGGANYEYKVLSIASYEANGKVFEHTVKFNIVPTNGTVELTYLDTTNDGRFDTVIQSGQLRKPVLPGWLARK